MQSASTRSLAIWLLLALAMPAPRMAAWLMGGVSIGDLGPTRHEPRARGRNRVPSPIRAADAATSARLGSGPDEPAAGPPTSLPSRIALVPSRPSARPGVIVAAPTAGPPRLRC